MRYLPFTLVVALSLALYCTIFTNGEIITVMKIDGIDFEGTGLKGFDEPWTALTAVAGLDVENSISIGSSGGGAGSGKASFSPITVSKHIDKGSPLLFKALVVGKHIASVTFSYIKTTPKGPWVWLKFVLSDVVLTKWTLGEGFEPDETISMSYGKIEWDFVGMDERGELLPAVHVGWDIVRNQLA